MDDSDTAQVSGTHPTTTGGGRASPGNGAARTSLPIELPLQLGLGQLGQQIHSIHEALLLTTPQIDRVACALYDADDDLLKTFVHSTRDGHALQGYEYRLSNSESLSMLARSSTPRLLTDIQERLDPSTAHSAYVLAQGFRSSFTVPMHHRNEFIGFVFFDSRERDAFPPEVTRELLLHANLITMAVANELVTIASVVGTIQMARDFTQLRDDETGEHVDRMARYSRIMAQRTAAHFGFDDETVEHVFLYAPMHDIGKIGIPDEILLKPGKLDPEEWAIMKSHTTKGAEMIDTILRDMQLIELPDRQMLRDIVELHHETLDGAGYPHGLRGDRIPPAARIVAVADIFDALTAERSYKPRWTVPDAVTELERMAERGKIDRVCVAALADRLDDVIAVMAAHPDP